jgi:hypothetical protein
MMDVAAMETMSEGVALMVAHYYQTLIRSGVTKAVAERLATHYQQMYFALIMSGAKKND